MPLALAGGLPTTGPPGKSPPTFLIIYLVVLGLPCCTSAHQLSLVAGHRLQMHRLQELQHPGSMLLLLLLLSRFSRVRLCVTP